MSDFSCKVHGYFNSTAIKGDVPCPWCERNETTAALEQQSLRVEDLREIVDIAADALSELVCLKDLKDKHGKTEHYLKRQPVAWDAARSALSQIDHGPCFPLKDRIEQLEAALKVYEDIVSDSYGVDGYHLNGAIAPWDDFDLPQSAGDSGQ